MILPKPIWKNIKEYEGKYQVNQLGQVRSLNYRRTGRIKRLKCSKDNYGYKRVYLCKDNKPKFYRVHRLVAETFIPNPNNLLIVNHIDENKANNCIWNLEWCTVAYNNNYGIHNEKISKTMKQRVKNGYHNNDTSKKIICIETGIIYNTVKEATEAMGCGASTISMCLIGKHKTACGYHWKYYIED